MMDMQELDVVSYYAIEDFEWKPDERHDSYIAISFQTARRFWPAPDALHTLQ